MKLYFLRHGIAEERRADLPDEKRQLTEEGIAEMHGVARGMSALGLRFDALLTSPLARARQTAKIAASELGLEARLREDRRLACGCSVAELADALAEFGGKDQVLLVGHEPDFSEMVSELIGGGCVRMKKAALACVDTGSVRPGAGELRWLLNPEHLTRLAG